MACPLSHRWASLADGRREQRDAVTATAKGGGLTEAQQTFNTINCGIHGVCERANSLLKTTFKGALGARR